MHKQKKNQKQTKGEKAPFFHTMAHQNSGILLILSQGGPALLNPSCYLHNSLYHFRSRQELSFFDILMKKKYNVLCIGMGISPCLDTDPGSRWLAGTVRRIIRQRS